MTFDLGWPLMLNGRNRNGHFISLSNFSPIINTQSSGRVKWFLYKLCVKEEYGVLSLQLCLKCNCALRWFIFFSVPADLIPGEKEDGGKLLPNWIIAVIAGGAGGFSLAILVLCLCCLKYRCKKANGGKKVLTPYYLAYILCNLCSSTDCIPPLLWLAFTINCLKRVL